MKWIPANPPEAPQDKDFYLPIGAAKIGEWDGGGAMFVGPWCIGPDDFSIIKKL